MDSPSAGFPAPLGIFTFPFKSVSLPRYRKFFSDAGVTLLFDFRFAFLSIFIVCLSGTSHFSRSFQPRNSFRFD